MACCVPPAEAQEAAAVVAPVDSAGLAGVYGLVDDAKITIEVKELFASCCFLIWFKSEGKTFSCSPVCCVGKNAWTNGNGLCLWSDGEAGFSLRYCCGKPAKMTKAAAGPTETSPLSMKR